MNNMKKREVLRLNQTVSKFNYESAKLELVMKMIKAKNALEEASENINKYLKELYKSIKPADIDKLNEELKAELAKDDVNKEKVQLLQVRIALLTNELNDKYKEAEEKALDESMKVSFDKITEEELDTLRKPKRELVDMEQNKRELIVTNHFSTSDLAALLPLIKPKA